MKEQTLLGIGLIVLNLVVLFIMGMLIWKSKQTRTYVYQGKEPQGAEPQHGLSFKPDDPAYHPIGGAGGLGWM